MIRSWSVKSVSLVDSQVIRVLLLLEFSNPPLNGTPSIRCWNLENRLFFFSFWYSRQGRRGPWHPMGLQHASGTCGNNNLFKQGGGGGYFRSLAWPSNEDSVLLNINMGVGSHSRILENLEIRKVTYQKALFSFKFYKSNNIQGISKPLVVENFQHKECSLFFARIFLFIIFFFCVYVHVVGVGGQLVFLSSFNGLDKIMIVLVFPIVQIVAFYFKN